MNKKIITALAVLTLSTSVLAGCQNKDNKKDEYASFQKVNNGVAVLDKNGTLLDMNNDKTEGLKVDIYLDPECPVCVLLEEHSKDFLKEYIKDGKINVRYHPIALFDKKSLDNYSYRGSAYILGAFEYSSQEVATKFLETIMSQSFRPSTQENGLLGKTDDSKYKDAFINAGGKEEEWNKIQSAKQELMKRVETETRKFANSKELADKSPLVREGQARAFTPFILIEGKDKAIMFDGEPETIGEQFKKAIDEAINK